MPWAPLLTDPELDEGLARIPDWRREGDQITRTVKLATFMDAIGLVGRVAQEAEAADHHPDMLIRWRRVTFTLSTHAAGGLTHRDMDLAQRIDALARDAGADPGQ